MNKSIISVLKLGTIAIIILLIGTSSNLNASDWWEKIKLNGDFRYRHEYTDQENSIARHRQRIRARFNITGQVSDETKIVLGISAGSTDPTSSNQTLTGAFSSKDLYLDMAYFEMKLKSVSGLKLIGGKTKIPFYRPGKTELIWDSDLRHEGIAVNYSVDFDPRTLQLIGSGLWITENGSSDNSYMIGLQAILNHNYISQEGKVAFGVSYFLYSHVKGLPTFYNKADGMGNSAAPGYLAKNYTTNFRLIEGFADIKFKLGNTALAFFGDFVTNAAADSLNTGWLAGLKIGKIKEPGSWALRYNYRVLEADAVVGAFTNSDFGGGGTDAKGHEVGGSYQLMKNSTLAITYFNNQIELEAPNKTNYQKWQIDLKFKF